MNEQQPQAEEQPQTELQPEQQPVVEVVQQQEGGEVPTEARPRGPDGKFAKPPVPKWVGPRIDELTGQARAAKAELERVAAENAALKAALEARAQAPGQAQVPNPAAVKPPVLPADEVERRVQERLQAERFEQTSRQVITEGQSKYRDFDSVLGNFRQVADLNTPNGISFVQAALDTGLGHDVLYRLGQDLDEAQRIIGLPPAKQAVELYKLSQELTKPQRTTQMPEPVRPLTARAPANPNELKDDAPLGDWMRQRQQQVQSARKSGRFQLH